MDDRCKYCVRWYPASDAQASASRSAQTLLPLLTNLERAQTWVSRLLCLGFKWTSWVKFSTTSEIIIRNNALTNSGLRFLRLPRRNVLVFGLQSRYFSPFGEFLILDSISTNVGSGAANEPSCSEFWTLDGSEDTSFASELGPGPVLLRTNQLMIKATNVRHMDSTRIIISLSLPRFALLPEYRWALSACSRLKFFLTTCVEPSLYKPIFRETLNVLSRRARSMSNGNWVASCENSFLGTKSLRANLTGARGWKAVMSVMRHEKEHSSSTQDAGAN